MGFASRSASDVILLEKAVVIPLIRIYNGSDHVPQYDYLCLVPYKFPGNVLFMLEDCVVASLAVMCRYNG
jgi:hypothetical protein